MNLIDVISNKQKSLKFTSNYILPPFGNTPQINAKCGLQAKQPSYLNKKGEARAISWKPYQHYYKLSAIERERLARKWQINDDCGVGTLLGFNGNIYIHGVDFDAKHDADLGNTIADLYAQYPILETCHTFTTPSGGLRIIFGTDEALEGFSANNGFATAEDGDLAGEMLTNNGGHTLLPGCKGYDWSVFPDELVIINKASSIFFPYKKRSSSQSKTVTHSGGYKSQYKDKIPLIKLLSKANQQSIKNGGDLGERDNTGIKIALDAIGCVEYLEENDQPYSQNVEELLHEYLNNCEQDNDLGNSFDESDIDRLIKSASEKESDKGYKSSIAPNYLNKIIINYFETLNNPRGNENKNNTDDCSIRLDLIYLADKGLDGSKLDEKILEISATYGRQAKDIWQLWGKINYELDTKDRLDESKSAIAEFLKIHDRDIKAADYLDPDLGSPIAQLAHINGVKQITLLTNLITVAATLIPTQTNVRLLKSGKGMHARAIIFSVVVGEPGSNKSGSISIFTDPLQALQKQAILKYELENNHYLEDKKNNKPPTMRHYFIKDATSEALIDIICSQPKSGILGDHDEIKEMIASLNAYKGGKGGDVQKLLRARDGAGFKVDRSSGKNLYCERSAYSIVGGIQPDVLADLMGNYDDSDGFWSRFIWTILENKNNGFPGDLPSINIDEMLSTIYQRLGNIKQDFILDSQGESIFKYWWLKGEKSKTNSSNKYTRIFMHKSRKLLGEIALILHCIDLAINDREPTKILPGRFMKMALDLIEFHYIPNLAYVYANAHEETKTSKDESMLVQLSRNKGWVTARLVARYIKAFRDKSPIAIREEFKRLELMGLGDLQGEGRKLEFRAFQDEKTPKP